MSNTKKKPGVKARGISKRGSREDVFDEELCRTIRKKLNLSEKDLPSKTIRKLTNLNNLEIVQWIASNPEGYKLKDMGVIAVSKHLPKEFRENKEETLDKIKFIDINEHRRNQIFKRYNVNIGNRVDFYQLQEFQRILPQVNLHTYFYNYKVMWFNQRNCKIKKAVAYTFMASAKLNKALHTKVLDGKDYYEWNFSDFFAHKINAKW